jgi:hypothetical protein
MIPHHMYYQFAILGLCVILHYFWPSRSALSPQPLAEQIPPDLVVKFQPLDIVEVIGEIMRQQSMS